MYLHGFPLLRVLLFPIHRRRCGLISAAGVSSYLLFFFHKIPGLVPDTVKDGVLKHLVNDIVNVHTNHTTCGIIGWRWELDVLSANGYGDVAYALITQKTYPSYGYEILNPVEPATSIWELWNSDSQGEPTPPPPKY